MRRYEVTEELIAAAVAPHRRARLGEEGRARRRHRRPAVRQARDDEPAPDPRGLTTALRVAYERAGEGPPLVLLHGYVGDGRSNWAPQIEGLSDAFTVIAWDGPGAGRSEDPPESFGMAGFADRLAEFLDELGLDRPHVAGLSFGGALALELFRRHPAIPRTLILASAYAGWAGSLPPDEADRRLAQVLDLADLPRSGS